MDVKDSHKGEKCGSISLHHMSESFTQGTTSKYFVDRQRFSNDGDSKLAFTVASMTFFLTFKKSKHHYSFINELIVLILHIRPI